jgi:hypothetical protein
VKSYDQLKWLRIHNNLGTGEGKRKKDYVHPRTDNENPDGE